MYDLHFSSLQLTGSYMKVLSAEPMVLPAGSFNSSGSTDGRFSAVTVCG